MTIIIIAFIEVLILNLQFLFIWLKTNQEVHFIYFDCYFFLLLCCFLINNSTKFEIHLYCWIHSICFIILFNSELVK